MAAVQAESMEAADATIDKLATDGRLNPALLLTMAKAYSAAKETDKTKDDVKEIMAHLYFKVSLLPTASLVCHSHLVQSIICVLQSCNGRPLLFRLEGQPNRLAGLRLR